MEWMLVKTVLSLVAVIALMVGMIYLLKRYTIRGGSGSSVVEVEMLGQRSLHPKRSVIVVKVMNKILVLGVSEQGMQTLTEITDKASLARVREQLDARTSESSWVPWRKSHPAGGTKEFSFATQWQRALHGLSRNRSTEKVVSGVLGWEAVNRPNGRRFRKSAKEEKKSRA